MFLSKLHYFGVNYILLDALLVFRLIGFVFVKANLYLSLRHYFLERELYDTRLLPQKNIGPKLQKLSKSLVPTKHWIKCLIYLLDLEFCLGFS